MGALGYRFDLERVASLLEAGLIDVSPLLSEPIPLEEIVEGALERNLRDPTVPPRVFVTPG